MTKRWLLAAVLLLTLGGCGDEPEAEPATVPVPATSSATPVPSDPTVIASRAVAARPARTTPEAVGEQRFVAVVQREMPGLAMDHREDEIAALARQVCAALAAGRSAGAVVAAGTRTFGIARASARALVRLAIDTVCPEQDRRLDEF